MFTREDISSLAVSHAKFQEAKSDCLGQLIVTPEIAQKTKAMKDSKSPGVDEILPKLLMEKVFRKVIKTGDKPHLQNDLDK